MSVRLNDFVSSSFAAFSLNKATQLHQKALSQLSSGSRITETQDDAGGLAVAFKFGTELKRLNASVGNFQNGLSFLQTQDGALGQMGDLLTRMSELQVLAKDQTKSDLEVQSYSTEYENLVKQFTTIGQGQFNGIDLFSQAGAANPLLLNDQSTSIQLSRPDLATLTAGQTLNVVSQPFQIITGTFTWDQAKLDAEARGGHLATFTSAQEWNFLQNTLLPSSDPRNLWLGGTDAGQEGTWTWITGEPWTYSAWNRAPFSNQPDNAFAGGENYLARVTSLYTQGINQNFWNDLKADPNFYLADYAPTGYVLEVNNAIQLRALLDADIASSIQQVATARAQNGTEQGAINNRINSMQTRIVSLDHARSEIQDTDVAKAVVELGRTNILMQSASSMLTQANNLNRDMILRLLS
jgi:flagellin